MNLPRIRSARPALAALAILSAGSGARAADRTEEAAEFAKDGLKLARMHEFDAARKLYEFAYRATPTAPLLFNLALMEMNSGESASAMRHFRKYVHEADAEPTKISIIKNDLIPKLYALTGHISLEQEPAGASLVLDGNTVEDVAGDEDKVLDVSPGAHVILVFIGTEHQASWRASLSVAAGERVIAPFERTAAAPAPSAPPPPVSDSDSPRLVNAPAAAAPAPPIKENTASARVPVTLTLGGAGVAALIGSFVFFELNSSAHNSWVAAKGSLSLTSACDAPTAEDAPACASLNSNLDNEKTYGYASLGFFIGGLALVGSSALTYFLWPRTGRAHAATVLPVFDPLTRSAGLVGSF